MGKSTVAETDHEPLVLLLITCTLDEVPPRVPRLRMQLMRFHFKEVNHVPGKEMYIADALTRMQSENTNRMATVPEEEMNIYVDSVLDSLPVSDMKLMEIKEAQDEDPPKFHLNDVLKPYWSARGELIVVHGILLKLRRIVVLSAMKLQFLIQEGHQGIGKCRERAKTSVW